MNGVTILFVYAVIMILATVILTKKEKNVERFCVGSRSENWLMSALSIAATWIWAPALFVSTEKAYSTGWVGLFWFLVPNALCLVIFIPFAKKIRKEMPEGMTLSGYMKEKYKSDGVKRVYLFQLIGLSVLSTGVEVNGTVGVTVNISEIVVLDGELFNAVINAIANGESPVLMFTGVIEGRNGSQERVTYRECILSGDSDIQNVSTGDVLKRAFALHCNGKVENKSTLTI